MRQRKYKINATVQRHICSYSSILTQYIQNNRNYYFNQQTNIIETRLLEKKKVADIPEKQD